MVEGDPWRCRRPDQPLRLCGRPCRGGFGDSILLPFDFTQQISFANWRYLDARYVAFTVAFALAMAWVITLQVHATRRVLVSRRPPTASRSGIPAIAATVVSLLPSFLCCSPMVPTLVGVLGLSVTTQLRTTGAIQYFFATQQNPLLLGALALVVGSGLWSTRKLSRAACLTDQCCATGDVPVADPATVDSAAPPARRLAAAATTAGAGSQGQDGAR